MENLSFRNVRGTKALLKFLKPIFSISVDKRFDRRFAEIMRANMIEKAIKKVKSFREKLNNGVLIRHCDTILDVLKLFLKFKLSIQLVFEKKLFKNAKLYKVFCKKLSKFFKSLSISNDANTIFLNLSKVMDFIGSLPDETNPIIFTISPLYLLWFFCDKLQIKTAEKFKKFIEKINGSILTYANSFVGYFSVIQFILSDILYD